MNNRLNRWIFICVAFVIVFSVFIVPGACREPNFQDTGKNSNFVFAVFGDSRLPGYVPYKKSQLDIINSFIEQMLSYDYGQIPFDNELTFNKKTQYLESIKIYPKGMPDNYLQLFFGSNRWVTKAIKGPSGVQILRDEGQRWVYKNVLAELRKYKMNPAAGSGFVIHTGDITYQGLQGKGKNTSPYWKQFNEQFMEKVPKDIPSGLVSRFFPALGNHETWGDENIQGFLETFPYLTGLGFNEKNRIYKFDYKNSRFIFLDSGDFIGQAPVMWNSKYPDYNTQMSILESWLKEAIGKNIKHVFVMHHYPCFTLISAHDVGALANEQNPHNVLKKYSSRLDIISITGHVHTTEFFVVDGVKYCVIGGGGGEQDIGLIPQPDGYPAELYWKGSLRVEEYSYLTVNVSGNSVAMFLHRWRPVKGKSDVVKVF
ncbi:MAG: metallophosphoesterase [Firmicutes bacterium]|nr:metallophosphoesterase [Bacillota bacterium]